VEDDGFKKMRFKPEIIVRAVHQHEDGFSLSKVQNHLWQHDGVRVTRWTISQWKKKYFTFFGSSAPKREAKDKGKNSH
jgi:transposase-like protein